MGRSESGATGPRRLTVQQAAGALGISEDAVRSRIKRGTLLASRDAGRVYVLVERPDGGSVGGQGATDQPGHYPSAATPELTEALREQVRYLRDQLRREQDAHAEARRLLAAALERIPALEAPESPPGASVSPEERLAEPPEGFGVGAGEYRRRSGDEGEPQRPQRSWWRRMFGG